MESSLEELEELEELKELKELSPTATEVSLRPINSPRLGLCIPFDANALEKPPVLDAAAEVCIRILASRLS